MSEPRTVLMFCEDLAHERFTTALVHRLAKEVSCKITMRAVSVRGGHGTALSELRAFQALPQYADLLVVAIDSNCTNWNRAYSGVKRAINPNKFPHYAIACPDPHVERWYVADPDGLRDKLEVFVSPGKVKCERNEYKKILREGLERAGHVVTLGGPEFASEIVEAMDLYRAGKNEPSLKRWIEDVRSVMNRWTL